MTPLSADQRLIIHTLERIGGGVVLPELAYQTHMDPIECMAVLDGLIRRREVYPWAYTTPTSAGVLLGMAQRSMPTPDSARGTLTSGPRLSRGGAPKGRDEAATIAGPYAEVEGRRL